MVVANAHVNFPIPRKEYRNSSRSCCPSEYVILSSSLVSMAAGQGGTKRRKATSAAPPESPESPDASDYRAGSETPSTGKASGLDADEKRRRFLERNRIAGWLLALDSGRA